MAVLKVEIKNRKATAGGCVCVKVEVAENTGDAPDTALGVFQVAQEAPQR